MPEQDYPDNVNTVDAEDGTTWVEIASVGTGDEARLLAGFLEGEGIPAQVEDVKFDEMPINFGAMGDIRIYVASHDDERAQALLRQRERVYEQLDDDDETLVTDEGPAVVDETSQTEGDDGATS
ncbi:MAG TPA: DUF2007 domain-containing protein [Thermoanaerobaculia bacterium]|nr:DUF2007 domain-containing protein [Thermoanaerobaculia bacterium]